ncbi:hypothetical protein NM688_g5225 [Phlebia brevispora]|uniref:Uncharacterized protein n=1 Tax=Phlebia brevispora TaxID=194682 RepID=A0ACC1SYB8_9APHY|nr:hypothetical protein NM688_g5225 [Phlebia brevispora]
MDADADTEDDRRRVDRRMHSRPQPRARSNNVRKGVRTYRVTNPDRKRPRISRSSSYEKHDLWHPSASATINEFGAKNQDYDAAYMLTHEVLSYTFGNK